MRPCHAPVAVATLKKPAYLTHVRSACFSRAKVTITIAVACSGTRPEAHAVCFPAVYTTFTQALLATKKQAANSISGSTATAIANNNIDEYKSGECGSVVVSPYAALPMSSLHGSSCERARATLSRALVAVPGQPIRKNTIVIKAHFGCVMCKRHIPFKYRPHLHQPSFPATAYTCHGHTAHGASASPWIVNIRITAAQADRRPVQAAI